MKQKCAVADCTRLSKTKGLCDMHHKRLLRGQPLEGPSRTETFSQCNRHPKFYHSLVFYARPFNADDPARPQSTIRAKFVCAICRSEGARRFRAAHSGDKPPVDPFREAKMARAKEALKTEIALAKREATRAPLFRSGDTGDASRKKDKPR